MTHRHKIARITWDDSNGFSGWTSESSLDNGARGINHIESIGIVMKSNRTHITISTSVTGVGASMAPLTIPRCAIKQLKYLRGSVARPTARKEK